MQGLEREGCLSGSVATLMNYFIVFERLVSKIPSPNSNYLSLYFFSSYDPVFFAVTDFNPLIC